MSNPRCKWPNSFPWVTHGNGNVILSFEWHMGFFLKLRLLSRDPALVLQLTPRTGSVMWASIIMVPSVLLQLSKLTFQLSAYPPLLTRSDKWLPTVYRNWLHYIFTHKREYIVSAKPHLHSQKGALPDQRLLAWHVRYSSPRRSNPSLHVYCALEWNVRSFSSTLPCMGCSSSEHLTAE